jgi:Leucine-rich repeat (LRR) protein
MELGPIEKNALSPRMPHRHVAPSGNIVKEAQKKFSTPAKRLTVKQTLSLFHRLLPLDITRLILSYSQPFTHVKSVCKLFYKIAREQTLDNLYSQASYISQEADEVKKDETLTYKQKVLRYRVIIDFCNQIEFFKKYIRDSSELQNIFQQYKMMYKVYTFMIDIKLTAQLFNYTFWDYEVRDDEGSFHLTRIPRIFFTAQCFRGLHTLSLAFHRLKCIPHEIYMLNSLSSLYLQGNGLTELPYEIGQLENLMYLHLSNNRIKELPRSMENLHRLKQIYLYNNLLSAFELKLGSVIHVMLDHNRIKEFPLLSNFPKIEELWLSSNLITSVPNGLFESKTLKLIWLQNNPIIWSDELKQKRAQSSIESHI